MGVRWQDKPPVNGREFTADDVVFNLKRYNTRGSVSGYNSNPPMAEATTITKTGPWEVTINTPVNRWGAFLFWGPNVRTLMMPPEVIQKYGNMANWRTSEGTGPYMLTDFVSGSSATTSRRCAPNAWPPARNCARSAGTCAKTRKLDLPRKVLNVALVPLFVLSLITQFIFAQNPAGVHTVNAFWVLHLLARQTPLRSHLFRHFE
jgi:hypothetical protein